MSQPRSSRPLVLSLICLVLLSFLAIWWVNRSAPKSSADSKNGKASQRHEGQQGAASSDQARNEASGPEASLPGKGEAIGQNGQQSIKPGNQKVSVAGEPVFGLLQTPNGLQPTRVRPRRALDTTRNYVLIGGVKAHPTRLLAKFSKSAQINQAKPALMESRYEPYRTPLNIGGLVVLESSTSEITQVANDEEARIKGFALAQRMNALRASGQFEYVEPDYIVSIDAVPTDSGFTDGTLWGLRNTGQNGGVSGVDVDAVRAWDTTTGSSNVVVGVIDTGIRYTHQDLAANMWTNPGETGGNKATNGIDDDNNGYVDDVYGINAITGTGNPMDDNNHGSHCAGTIGAQANGGGPHVGVAWQVRLMALKFLAANGSGGIADAYECIEYGVSMDAKILSNSWGGGGFSDALFGIIGAAAANEILFVAAAGNSKSDNDISANYPSNYNTDNMVAVAAIDRAGSLASFSNYGATKVHLGAPGVAIYSCTAGADNSYASFNGTSMATPHVSGVAALVAAQYPNESMRALRNRLTSGAQPTASLAGKVASGGRVNAYNSLNLTADGNLEVEVIPADAPLVGGRRTRFQVIVSDVEKVLGATVRARNEALGIDVYFYDMGQMFGMPDAAPNDGIYTADIQLPDSVELGGAGGATSINLEFSVTAQNKANYLQTKSFPFLNLAPNDNFDNATTITGVNTVTTEVGTVAATKELGEPNHAGNSGGKSVWWKWTAPSSGRVQIDTDGSSFDTLLAVYTGVGVAFLTELASNDDLDHATFQFKSRLVFDAVQGETYYIAVDGFQHNVDFIVYGKAVVKLFMNTPPVANDANFVVQDGAPTNLSLVASDADGQELDYTISQAPANGRASTPNSVDGTFSYTPKPGFRGVDTFRYHVSDGIENSLTKQVSITVNAGQDSDGDGIPDAWEIAHNLLVSSQDGSSDYDNDGLTNFQEYMGSVNPRDAASGPMKIAIGPANASFKASANSTTSPGGNAFRNNLSNQRGPTSPTLAWQVGRNALFGSSTFIEGNTVVTTRWDPQNYTLEGNQSAGTIVAHRLDTGALLWEKQLPIDFPETDNGSYVIGVRDGKVYASRGSDAVNVSYIYALRLSDGVQLWRSQEACMREGLSEVGPTFMSNGDLIVTSQLRAWRINCLTGATVWKADKNDNLYSIEVANGDRLYGMKSKYSLKTRRSFTCVTAIDPQTGLTKYDSAFYPDDVGVASGYQRMFVGPDGTVYKPVSRNQSKVDFLYAFEDTGTTLRIKWKSPIPCLTGSPFAVGPDGSVYSFDREWRIVRLRPEDGAVLNRSFPLGPWIGFPKRTIVDSTGVLFVCDYSTLYSFNADLTERWSFDTAGFINHGGPVLGADGTLIVASSGANGISALRVPEDQQPVIPPTSPNMSIIYTGNMLEQADSPAGPWTVIPNAKSPWTVPMNAQKKFYRVKLY